MTTRKINLLSPLFFLFITVFVQAQSLYTEKTDAQCFGSATGSIRLTASSDTTIDSVSINGISYSSAAIQQSGYQFLHGVPGYRSEIALDSKGNTYVFIEYQVSTTFLGVTYVPGNSAFTGIILLKFSPLGEIEYIKHDTGGGSSIGDLQVDSNDNVYISGRSNTFNGVLFTQTGPFIMKLNESGATVWTRTIGGNLNDIKLAVENGHIAAGGAFSGSISIENGTGITVLNAGVFDAVVLMYYDLNGNLIWSKTGQNISMTNFITSADVTIDQSQVYFLVRMEGACVFENDTLGNPSGTIQTGAVVAYNKTSGVLNWANTIGCEPTGTYCPSIFPSTIAAFNNKVYISGHANDTLEYGGLIFSSADMGISDNSFFLTTDQGGNALWMSGLKNPNSNGTAGGGDISSINRYRDSLIIVTGEVRESVNMFGSIISNPGSNRDGFIAIVDSNGFAQSYTLIGDNSNENIGKLSINESNTYVILAYNIDSAALGNPGIVTNLDGQDTLIAKYSSFYVDTTFINLTAGGYNVGIESGGNIVSDSVQLLESPLVSVAATVNDNVCFGGSNGSITLTTSGGTAPYTYTWSGPNNLAASTQFLNNLIAGNYHLTITDAQGCIILDTISVSEPAQGMSNTFLLSVAPTCGFCNGEVSANVSGGLSPYSFSWNGPNASPMDTLLLQNACDTFYTLQVTDANNCIFNDSIWVLPSTVCDSVWPGDINYDGVANNSDFVFWAMANSYSGSVRFNATTNWEGQPALNWNTTIGGGTNSKHADCNGDGIVSAADTNVISLNYGLTHTKNGPKRSGTELKIVLDLSTTAIQNDSFSIKGSIDFQSTSGASDSLFGLVYNLGLQALTGDILHLKYEYSSPWLIDGAGYSKRLDMNQIDIAVARVNQTAAFGFGKIGEFTVSGKLVNGGIPDFKIQTNNEALYAFNGNQSSIDSDELVYSDLLTVKNLTTTNSSLSVYPNPSSEEVTLVLPVEMEGKCLVNIYSIDGSLIESHYNIASNGRVNLSAKNLPHSSGSYLMVVEIASQQFNVMIMRM